MKLQEQSSLHQNLTGTWSCPVDFIHFAPVALVVYTLTQLQKTGRLLTVGNPFKKNQQPLRDWKRHLPDGKSLFEKIKIPPCPTFA